MQSEECRVQNAECRMQSAECRVQNAECRMQNAEAGDYKPPSEREGDRIAVEGAHVGTKLYSLIHALSLSHLTVTAPSRREPLYRHKFINK